MLLVSLLVFIRIFSNSLSGVFQKILSKDMSSLAINFISFLILIFICLFKIKSFEFNSGWIFVFAFIMGLFGSIGNAFQIKSLRFGELSSLTPLNSYKIIFSLIFSFLLIGEIPSLNSFIGVILIVIGSIFLFGKISNVFSLSAFKNKSLIYRIIAVFFTALEAIFIKKVILLSNPNTALFLWALFSCLFSLFFFGFNNKLKIKFDFKKIMFLILLASSMEIMQLSTNILFDKMNVSYALCLFQLSAIFSILLGYKIFKEQDITRKVLSSIVMIIGACIIILDL